MELVRGIKTRVNLVSEQGEEARLSLQQGLEFTPQRTEEIINEFDNDEAAMVVSKIDKYDASLSYLESSDKAVAAVLMNLPLNSEVVPVNNNKFAKVAWYANMKGEDGKIFRSFMAKPGTVKEAPVSIQIDGSKNAKKLTLTHPAIYDIMGAAVGHDKFAAADFTQTTETYGATLGKTAIELPAGTINGAASYHLCVRKNGAVVESGFTVTANKLEIGATQPGVQDVWEVFYCYTAA